MNEQEEKQKKEERRILRGKVEQLHYTIRELCNFGAGVYPITANEVLVALNAKLARQVTAGKEVGGVFFFTCAGMFGKINLGAEADKQLALYQRNGKPLMWNFSSNLHGQTNEVKETLYDIVCQ